MKSKFYNPQFSLANFSFVCALLLALSLLFAPKIAAQEEGEPVVIDRVFAQVNGETVTLSEVRREMNQAAEALAQNQMRRVESDMSKRGVTAAEIEAELTRQQPQFSAKAKQEVEAREPEFIANLINEKLVIQQGKELGLESEVDAEVNKRLLDLAKEYNLKTIAEVEQFMTARGVSPSEFRAAAKRGIMTNYVFGNEVDRKTYSSLTPTEIKKFYDANPARFIKPTNYTLSEIFISNAGRTPEEAQKRAVQIVAQARAAGEFATLAAASSDRPEARENKGKIGAVTEKDLNPLILDAIKNLKTGGVSDPIKTPDGFIVIRVDERADGGAGKYDEAQVREALTVEKLPQARAAYVKELRSGAYLKIADDYRAAVEAELNKAAANAPAPVPKTSQNTTAPAARQ